MNILDQFLSSEAFTNLMLAVLTAVISLVFMSLKIFINYLNAKYIREDKYKAAVDKLAEGVAFTEDEFVAWAKNASADGKLSKEEIKKAQKLAYDRAIQLADKDIIPIMKEWTDEKVSALTKQILGKLETADKLKK